MRNITKYIYNTLFIIGIFFLFNPFTLFSQCQQPVLLNSWTSQGGTWNLSPDNLSVLQTVNGGDVYYLSPNNYINVILTGNLKTTDNDNDIMGFVFGVEGTIGTAPYHCYRFQWDEGGDGNGMYIKELSQTGTNTTYSNPGNYWTRNFTHNFSITYTSTFFEVYVDGNLKTHIDGCFNPGKFGFYNHSQAQVTYSNFTVKPVAEFLVNDSVCFGEPVIPRIFCNNNTAHNYSSITWYLGDGTIVNDSVKLSHTYQFPGTYPVKLVIQDAFGCIDSVTKQVVVSPVPIANFSSSSVCFNVATAFTDSSSINPGAFITQWKWDFNTDGATDNTTQHPTHTYSDNCGSIDAKLVVISDHGCKDSIEKSVTVHCLPDANYTVNTVCKEETTQFTDASTGNINTWKWNLGDAGATDTAQSATHIYSNCGVFDCKLVVTTANGCKDSITKPVTVHCKPNAAFSAADVCFGESVIFSDSSSVSSGNITAWSWDFDNNSADPAMQNPDYIYNNHGAYNVRLIVTTDNSCKDTIINTVVVHPLPIAQFSLESVCLTDTTFYIDQSTVPTIPTNDNIASWNWNFGDSTTQVTTQNTSHIYAAAGSYNVELKVVSSFGCKDSITKTAIINPKPQVNFTANDSIGCGELCVNFQDLSTILTGNNTAWDWSYGNSNPNGTTQNPGNCYTNGNPTTQYTVSLTVTSDSGCVSSLTKNNYIQVSPNPTAAFSFQNVCDGDNTPFTYLSSIPSPESITQIIWNYGDGQSDNNVQNHTHQYAGAGSYTVKLKVVSSYSCSDSISKTITVNPNPVVTFTSNDTAGCSPLCTSFINTSSVPGGGVSGWQWNMGDGSPDNTSQDVSHCYANTSAIPVSFSPTLTVTSDSGCVSVLTKNNYITAYPMPIAAFIADPVSVSIANPVITITNTSSGAPIASYNWNMGDNTTSTLQTPAPYTYPDTGTYTITLITTSEYGCESTTAHSITIEQDFMLYIPNSFSPNGDGTNDVFIPQGMFVNNFHMEIYDRWGNLIFITDDITQPWTGIANYGTAIAQPDVYIYSVTAKDFKDKQRSFKGTVTLIK